MTILIALCDRTAAYTVFHTDMWKTLVEEGNTRFVCLVPAFAIAEYRALFLANSSIHFVPYYEPASLQHSFFDALFYRLSLFYAYTPLARLLRRAHLQEKQGKVARYALSCTALILLGGKKSWFIRRLLRWLDRALVRHRSVGRILETHTPDVVFVPGLKRHDDQMLIREARRRGISVVALSGSPEEVMSSTLPLRVLPDRLLVYNEHAKEEAVRFCDMPVQRVEVVGNPLFDRYAVAPNMSRSDFCARFDIEPSHRIIFFLSSGDRNPGEWQVLADIESAIMDGALRSDTSVLVRHYTGKNMYTGGMSYGDHIIFDTSKMLHEPNKTYLDILAAEAALFVNMFFYADVVVTTAGLFAADAAVFDKPTINIAYDGAKTKPRHESVARYYSDAYPKYRLMRECGASVCARSRGDLIGHIAESFEYPEKGSRARACLLSRTQSLPLGSSGARIAQHVIQLTSRS